MRSFRSKYAPIVSLAALACGLAPAAALARGGWEDPPGGWEYVYEAATGQDVFVAGDNVVGLLDGSWAQHTGTSYWDGSAPGVFNTTELDPVSGLLLPPCPGGVMVVCPEAELGEDGSPLCYLAVEDVGNPTDAAVFLPAYADPSNRKLYFHRAVTGNSEDGWTLVARLRLSPQAIDPAVNMSAGFNGADLTDLPMVAVHDGEEGTVGFSINDAGRLVVLEDGVANEIDIGDPTGWVTVWMSATERPGGTQGVYDLKVWIDGAAAPALVLSGVTAPLSEITGSPDDWISLGSGRTGDDAAFQIDYVAYKQGAWEPGSAVRCPTAFTCAPVRLIGRTSVNLTWTIPAGITFDAFDLKRGTETLAAGLPGTTTSFVDVAPLGGLVTYELMGRSALGDCSVTCISSQCLFDIQCSFRPGAVGGLLDGRLTWSNPGGIDGISVRRRIQKLDELTELDEELGVLPGTATEFLDIALDSTDLTRITYTVTATIGDSTCAVQCRPTTCPQDLACNVDRSGAAPAIDLSWTTGRPFDSITVSRRTDASLPFEPKATLAGDATSFRDEDVSILGYYQYEVMGVQAGTAEPCPAVGCQIFITPPEAPYAVPAGGWDYIYDAEAVGSDAFHAVTGEPGNLDGTWIRSTVEDQWDGSRSADTGPAPGGPAPGGLGLVRLPNADPCARESRGFLLIEDVGDPRVLGYPDPSNRKIFLGRDLGLPDQNLLRAGVTYSVRLRLRPAPVDIPIEPGNAPWDGDGLAEGLGMVGIHFRNPGTPETVALGASAGLAVALDEGGAHLSLNPELAVAGIRTEQFHTLWATIVDPEGDDTYEINLYLDGSTVPIAAPGALQAPKMGTVGNDVGLGTAVNFLTIGSANTGADSSVEVDFVAVKAGVHVPVAEECAPCANNPPTARVAVTPPGGQVKIAGGTAQVTLDGGTSDSGDGAGQSLTYSWSKVSGPAGDSIAAPAASSTAVDFTAPGTFIYRLRVDDGQSCRSSAFVQATITVLPPDGGGKTFRRGDTDSSGALDLSDAIGVLQHLFLGGPRPNCWDAADSDDNGGVDISDSIANLQYQFLGGPPPASPGPSACGPDVNEESPDLGCDGGC